MGAMVNEIWRNSSPLLLLRLATGAAQSLEYVNHLELQSSEQSWNGVEQS